MIPFINKGSHDRFPAKPLKRFVVADHRASLSDATPAAPTKTNAALQHKIILLKKITLQLVYYEKGRI